MENEDNVNIIVKKKVEKKKPVADTISIKEIYDKGNDLKKAEYRCLYYIAYLTGARIGEVLQLRVRDIDYNSINEIKDDKIITRKIAVFDLITEKRRDHPKRKIPVMYEDSQLPDAYGYEKLMVKFIQAFTSNMLMEEKIFRVKRTSAANYFSRYIQIPIEGLYKGKRVKLDYKMHPHYLRHCRITHMREYYGFDILDLKQFAGWTSTSMTDIYLHAGWKNLIGKMIKNG